MSLPGFLGQPQATWAPTHPNGYEGDAPHPSTSKSYGPATPPAVCRLRIRRLPRDTTDAQLRLMLLFSEELVDVNILPIEASLDPGYRCAIVCFKSPTGAQQAKEMLHGKSFRPNTVELIVENLIDGAWEYAPENPLAVRRYPLDNSIPTHTNGSASVTSPGPGARQPTRTFPPNPIYSNTEFAGSSDYYQNLFSPTSPFGNHLAASQTLGVGKTLIHDTAEDDETRELLKDPVAYAENGATQQRRATAPQLPIARMAALSLNTANGTGPIAQYPHSLMTPQSAHGNGMSPTGMNNGNHLINYQHNGYNRNNFPPPVNPADQNPPCNTLYVGNLPVDTAEEELKSIFQKQRGYKRLCFRTKQNGPMCFVEFEDVTLATRALHELYGKLLHNSTKGGIRLSFSKNPLGVRSNQPLGVNTNGSMASMNGLMAPPVSGYPVTSGPPPGLAAPPGLHRNGMNTNTSTPNGANGHSNGNVWGHQYVGNHSATGSTSPPNGHNPSYQPYTGSTSPPNGHNPSYQSYTGSTSPPNGHNPSYQSYMWPE